MTKYRVFREGSVKVKVNNSQVKILAVGEKAILTPKIIISTARSTEAARANPPTALDALYYEYKERKVVGDDLEFTYWVWNWAGTTVEGQELSIVWLLFGYTELFTDFEEWVTDNG